MKVLVRKIDDIAVIEPEGAIDTRSAPDFQKAVLECLTQQVSRFVISFGKVELISSVGLRVLIMLAKRVSQIHGGLALCGLSDQVKTVFEVIGLTDHFTIVERESDAIASVGRGRKPLLDAAHTKLSDLVGRLIAVGLPPIANVTEADKAAAAKRTAALADHVAQLLTQQGHRSSPGDPVKKRR